jgi:hypothetical protein
MVSLLLRRALAAAALAAAGAAGSYLVRRFVERRTHGRARRQEHVDVSRWEGEGGSPPDLPAAVPHHSVTGR